MTQAIVLLSGKRKSGKDYLAEKLLNIIGADVCEIIRISEPIKAQWSQSHALDLQQLLSDGAYKEQYRKEMIRWSDDIRRLTPSFFCQEAFEKASKPIVIVSDIRRRTDIAYFERVSNERQCKLLLRVRISVSDAIRMLRGWSFETGVDDVSSECDLDEYSGWNMQICNDSDRRPDETLSEVVQRIRAVL